MLNKIIYIFLLLTFSAIGQGGFKREYQLPLSLTNEAKAVFETTPNNYIMGGIVVDSLNGIQFNRLALFGINSLGQRTWTKKYGNSKFMYFDNTLISRWFYKKGNFLYNVCCVKDSNNQYLGVLMKFDFNGDTIWQKKFYDANYTVGPQMVTGSVDGGFLITGFFEQTGNRPVLLIKTDANGTELWRKYISKTGPNVHSGSAIIQDTSTKKIVIAGYQYIGTATKDNILICDSLGNKINQYTFSGPTLGGLFVDLIQSKDKKIVAVGQAIYPVTLGGQNLTMSYAIKFDINNPSPLIWKIDNFDKLALFNTFATVNELKNGDLLLGGIFDTMRQNNLAENRLTRLTKISSSGVVKWNRHYNYSKDISVDNKMGVASINIASNGDWLAAIQVFNYPSPNPFFFVRYDSTGCDSSLNYCLSVGIEERKKIEDAISIYPNPIKSVINLNFSSVSLSIEDLSIKIVDVMGRVIKEDELKIEHEKTNISAGEMEKGIYFLQIFDNNKLIAIKKIVKE